MAIEWVDYEDGTEVAYIALPDDAELKLTHRVRDGKYTVVDVESGIGIPEDSGFEGRAGALQGAAEFCRNRASDWVDLAQELDRKATLYTTPARTGFNGKDGRRD